MTYKPEKLPVDKDTHKLLNYDSLYYVHRVLIMIMCF